MKYFNNLYEKNKKLFGENPLDIIKIGEKFLNKKNKIVDLGCGQGRNILYLLRKGYNIYGIDSNEIAIKDLKIKFKKVKKKFILGNVKYIERFYNFNIISSFLFHFIDNQKEFIEKCQKMTLKGGIHIISDFLEKNDEKRGFLSSEEIKFLYKDWEILYYEEKEVKTLFGYERPSYNLIAKKYE